MKSVIFFFGALFCSILVAHAQDFNGGIVAGMSTSQIDGDAFLGYNKAGLVFGGFVNRELKEKLTAEFGIIYIGKGSKEPENPDSSECSFCKITLRYIEVPVLLQFKRLKVREKELKLILEAGLSFGVLFSYKEEDEHGDIELIEFYKSTELGFIAGLSYPLSETISFNSRFEYSILPIANQIMFNAKTWRISGGSFNRLFSFTLKYQFKVHPVE
ncbi:MAG: porin family protein [Bacteroidota bacterium]